MKRLRRLGRMLDLGPTQRIAIAAGMAAYRDLVGPGLRRMLRSASARERTHARLALLPDDPAHADELVQDLLRASPPEALVIRGALADLTGEGVKGRLRPLLW